MTSNATILIDQYKLGWPKNFRKNNIKKSNLRSFYFTKQLNFKLNKKQRFSNNFRKKKRKSTSKRTKIKNKICNNNNKKDLFYSLELM